MFLSVLNIMKKYIKNYFICFSSMLFFFLAILNFKTLQLLIKNKSNIENEIS